MPRKILYLINPISGTRKKGFLLDLVEKKTSAADIPYSIMQTNAKGEYGFLKEKISQEKFTDVVVCGGDGTVNAIVHALLHVDVRIGILPLGSGNGLAFAAKIPKQPIAALNVIFAGHSSYIDSFYINERFSCMLCGIGFDALVAHEFAKEKRRGLQTYIRVSVVQFFKALPYKFEIELGERRFSTDAFFISIANSNQFGNNFTIAPQASLSDGLLDVVIVKKMSKLQLPFSVISQVTGINAIQPARKFASKNNIIYFQTDKLTIKNLDSAPLHIDGDPANTANEFNIRILPNCFQLLQPAPVD